MAQYVVTITNGQGLQNLPIGEYNVTADIFGYSGVLDPSTFTATGVEGSEAFTLAATGTLTLNVNDTGAEGGTPITAGSFIRCNVDGSTSYGTAKTVSAQGVCEFPFVPFGTSGSPATFYIKQLTSDAEHNIDPNVITVAMEAETQSLYVANPEIAEQTFTLEDANYAGLVLTGEMTFDGPQ